MLGAVILAVVIVVLIPVGVLMSGAAGAFLIGTALKDEREAAHHDSELVDLL